MPLAITRLTVAQLPARLTLTDAMGMVPGLTLSRFPQVVVGARISKSGNATPQSGDLQTLSFLDDDCSDEAGAVDHCRRGSIDRGAIKVVLRFRQPRLRR